LGSRCLGPRAEMFASSSLSLPFGAHVVLASEDVEDEDTSDLLQRPRYLRRVASSSLLVVVLISGSAFFQRSELLDKVDFHRIINKNEQPCYSQVHDSTCEGQGKMTIADPLICHDAGVQLNVNLSSTQLTMTNVTERPHGCYLLNGNKLWLATNHLNKGNRAVGPRAAICLAYRRSCIHATMALQDRFRQCFKRVSGATCEDTGSLSITRPAACRVAAAVISQRSNELDQITLQVTPESERPQGCYMLPGRRLWFATNPDNKGQRPVGDGEAICISSSPWCLAHSTALVVARPPSMALPSLFCFVVTLPHGPEPKLIMYQFVKRMGIFACNRYSVFSEVSEWLILGRLRTFGIGRMKAAKKLWLENLDIFLRAWRQVKRSGHFLQSDWTIKVDPDSVWFPSRLRPMLRPYSNPDDSIFFANCDQSGENWHAWNMQGPIEIISRGAARNFTKGYNECLRTLGDGGLGASGVHDVFGLGEDQFVDRCLQSQGARKERMPGLLSDLGSSCRGSSPSCAKDWVAYHHYKTPKTFFDCVSELGY